MLRLALLAILAPCLLFAQAAPTPTPAPGSPVTGRWFGTLNVYQNSCGPGWAKPQRFTGLRVQLNEGDTGFDEDYGPFCTARSHSLAGWWRGRWYYPDAEHYGLMDLYITTRWVSPETGNVYRHHRNWWWSHNPAKKRQRAKKWIDVEVAGYGQICRVKYQGFIRHVGRK